MFCLVWISARAEGLSIICINGFNLTQLLDVLHSSVILLILRFLYHLSSFFFPVMLQMSFSKTNFVHNVTEHRKFAVHWALGYSLLQELCWQFQLE
jgi:hypothetical protein